MFKQQFTKLKVNIKNYVFIGYILLTITSIGITSALILINTEPKTSTFIPGEVSCEVQADYSIKNTGNTSAYIRADVIVNWMDSSGNIYAILPEYTITSGTDWKQSENDGYYYYAKEVNKTESTTGIISNITTNNITPEGYSLAITILAEAIQKEDYNKAIKNAWGNRINYVRII